MKKENNKTNKKLFSATAMLALSAAMLGTATYAWFTMNKTVSVTGMEVKAHAEEGLLINEVAAAGSTTWDEQAQGDTTPTLISMRPASSYDLATFWHANSKKSADEAGIDSLVDTVDIDGSGTKYLDVTSIADEPIVTAAQASGNTKAETHVYYSDAHYGEHANAYDDGEGYYVVYKYYLKSSGDTALSVTDLQAQVKATLASGSSAGDLDPALRVGIKYGTSGMKIFAPIPGAASGSGATNTSYDVTKNTTGTSTETVTPVVASTAGDFTAYTTINSSAETIPSVTTDGAPVYVYVWFEGEDTHCMSDNLSSALAAYDIDINIKDADLN